MLCGCWPFPGAITLILLLVTRRKFPNPEHFEPEPKAYVPFRMKKEFLLYSGASACLAFGFIDYSIIIMAMSPGPSPVWRRACGKREV